MKRTVALSLVQASILIGCLSWLTFAEEAASSEPYVLSDQDRKAMLERIQLFLGKMPSIDSIQSKRFIRSGAVVAEIAFAPYLVNEDYQRYRVLSCKQREEQDWKCSNLREALNIGFGSSQQTVILRGAVEPIEALQLLDFLSAQPLPGLYMKGQRIVLKYVDSVSSIKRVDADSFEVWGSSKQQTLKLIVKLGSDGTFLIEDVQEYGDMK